jgi:GMP synthase-like glutamine amidotransferase
MVTPPRIRVLQHEPFEGPGLIAEWAEERGYPLTVTEVFAGEALPEVDTFDWLVIMGGGMSVNDEVVYPWLKPEKELVRKAIAANKVIIGICLGSQMIASALGKRVYKNDKKEIGWYPVQLTAEGSTILNAPWNNQTFFHWHGETFELPDGAAHLAYSEGCKNQAVCMGKNVYGFQFHPETNRQTLHQMVNAGGEELVPAEYVMPDEEILKLEAISDTVKPLMFEFLDKVVM